MAAKHAYKQLKYLPNATGVLGKKRIEELLQKLVVSGSKLPIGKKFMAQKPNVKKDESVPHRSTEEYSIGVYKVPVPLDKVSAFGSHFISPAHQNGVKNAVDFYVPKGTVITAPARGIIFKFVESFNVHGISTSYWLKGNGIGITCPNGEYIWMEHLQHGFATKLGIEVGQKVRTGDIIGISGNTGFSENPHVHMEVLKFIGDPKSKESLEDYRNYITKKIRFDVRDIPFDLYQKEKKRITAKQNI